MTQFAVPRLAALILLTATAFAAGAQSTKPPAGGPTLGGGAASTNDKMLTRDELRACLKQQETLATRRKEAEADRAGIEREKDDIEREQAAVKAQRAEVEAKQQAITDLNARYKAYAEQVDAWNARVAAVEGRTGTTADRERDKLGKEREGFQATQDKLEADRTKLGEGGQQVVDTFNARATALDQKIADWNRRGADLSARGTAINAEREQWGTDCGGRRYREEDERAVRNGK